MSEKDIDKIIEELRGKAASIELVEEKKKIDKKSSWQLAKKIRKSLNDDNLPAPHSSRA